MRINSIQYSNPRSEVVVVNRKPAFTANPLVKPNTLARPNTLSEFAIKRFGLNMETRIGYDGPRTIQRAPEDYKNGLGAILNKMDI